MKFAFIAAKMAEFPITVLCRMLEVSRAGFYASVDRPPPTRTRPRSGRHGSPGPARPIFERLQPALTSGGMRPVHPAKAMEPESKKKAQKNPDTHNLGLNP